MIRFSSTSTIRASINCYAESCPFNCLRTKNQERRTQEQRGQTALMWPLLKLLIELGANPTLVNVDQRTPLLAATAVGILSNGDESAGTEQDAIEVVEFLLALGADINAVDRQVNTSVHSAVYENRSQRIAFLAEPGAQLAVWNRPNRRDWTPLDTARHRSTSLKAIVPATLA